MQEQPLRVLLIEHDEAFARAVEGMLQPAREMVGEIVSVRTLEAAVERLAREQFGVILLDFFQPDGTGPLNIALLKEQAARVPVIVMGVMDDEAIAVEAVHAGAQDYLVKGQLNSRWLLRSIRYAMERHEADLALLAAEEKYRGIFDHLVEGIFQTTPDGHYRMANAALARIYGYGSPEDLQRSVTDIGRKLYVQPGRREEFKRIMDEHDTITAFESEIYRKDNSRIWISENCRAIRNAKGKLLYYEGTVEDITQRRAAEEEVRKSEAVYHSLVETMPQNVFRKDLEGRFTFANQQYCEHYRCELKDILGKTDYDFFPEELAKQYRADDEYVMRTGETKEITEVHHPLGQQRSMIQVVKTPLYGPDKKIVGLQGIFWDITKEREMEEKLRDSEALYHSLVETLPQNIFRKDMAGRFTFANQQFCKTLERELKDIVGKTDYDFFPPEMAAKFQADDREVTESGKMLNIVEENQRAGHSMMYVQVVKTVLRDANGEVSGLQGIFWDITPQRIAEQQIRNANAELARSREQLRVKNDQMEADLKMARDIQLAMLPRDAAAGLSPFQFTHRYFPAGTIGGDFFSISMLSEVEAAVFVCDVTGHGVRSALVTAMIRALVEELRPLANSPGEFMTKLNSDLFAILKHTGRPLLTTAFYLVVNAATGKLHYANAGHPKPFLVRRGAGEVMLLKNSTKKGQPALGLFEKGDYHTSEAALVAGDMIMLFTDGVFEVHHAKDEVYTQGMLAEAVKRRLAAPASKLFDGLLGELREYSVNGEFQDDVCLVGIEFGGAKQSTTNSPEPASNAQRIAE